ncbi:phytanoyl-CoA dioxygenase family protein [Streptomyces sp. NPDC050264]|uniref:phytanoyl-CoA dioxygenase family protein n=1 Tax=Streptomyces sp. NPDC050264 TaxID=3155038 RepID=UPI0034258D5E
MVDMDSRGIQEHGFVRLPGLAAEETLAGLRRAVGRLEELARGRTVSDDDFIFEAAGVGGWTAWQQGEKPLPGVLRSANRIHVHVPGFEAAQRALRLAGGPVAAAVGAPGTLINSFLWAKPPVVGSAKPWHQDMAFAPPGFDTREHGIVTVWIALERAGAHNGCLEFLPGSHRLGLLPHAGDRERVPGQPPLRDAVEPHVADEHLPRAHAPVAVPLEAGSAVMFDGMVLHRSAPNTTAAAPRTAVSFVYRVPRPAWSREPAAAPR